MKRIQRKGFRDYSWRSNPNAVYVGRGKGEGSRYGNPFKIGGNFWGRTIDRKLALKLYRKWLDDILSKNPDFLKPLIGKDLVCFCPLDQPCHADILIEYVQLIYGGD